MFTVQPEAVVRHILPREACRQFKDTVFTCLPHPAYQEDCIPVAEAALAEPLPVLPLTEYLAFSRDGNRSRFEKNYFARRNRLIKLLLGELAEKQERFIPAIMDTMWAILEEATWVIPAHNLCFETNQSAPHEFGVVRHVDLFSAATAADLAVVTWYLEEAIEQRMPRFFMEHLRAELHRRVFEPYCSDATGVFMDWKGIHGNYVNNWNPWIGLNCATAALFAEKDEEVRKQVCEKALTYVNNFLKFIPENGTCMEGPTYFTVSNAAFVDLLELMRDATGGKADFRHEPMVKRMACSVKDFYVGKNRWVSIADCSAAKVDESFARYLDRTGKRFDDAALQYIAWHAYGKEMAKEAPSTVNDLNSELPLRTLWDWHTVLSEQPPVGSLENGCCYNDANEQFTCRINDFYFRLKGGHNHEPHGHNDVGEFLLYYKGEPVFIDPAVETYCADTFNENRYSLWYIRSDWHNTPVINGTVQHGGPQLLNIPREKTATDVTANPAKGWAQMELSAAYPKESGILSLLRRAEIGEAITVTDTIKLTEPGEYAFHLVSLIPPKVEGNRLIFPLEDRPLICAFTPGFEAVTETRLLQDDVMRSTWGQDRMYRTRIVGTVDQGSFSFQILL